MSSFLGPARSINEAWCRAIVDELVHHGLKHAVVAPGSRSAPLALALAERDLPIHVVVDERSAAFFALGLAKASRAPVLLLCTSGSAGAHFLPAVIEAHLTGVALIVVTADRPPELHGFGAHQSIDQTRLFGVFATFVDLGPPHASLDALRHVRALAARAMGTGAVVHWNAPFREPLAPPAEAGGALLDDCGPGPAVPVPELRASSLTLAHVRGLLERAARPAFMVGPVDDPSLRAPLVALARRLGAPVLAEISSGLRDRSGTGTDADVVVAHAELIVRVPSAPVPDLLVRLGGTATTRALMAFADRSPAVVVVAAAAAAASGVSDPTHKATSIVISEPAFLLRDLEGVTGHAEPGWLAHWQHLDARAAAALERRRGESLDEPAIARATIAAVAAGDVIVLASSMPIRDAEAFAGRTAAGVRVVVNRGVCGIDGLVSLAAGAALASGRETTLLCGDLALLHDIGGLVAARMAVSKGARLKIVVVHNDGGGIFAFLPVAERTAPSTFTALFTAPHGLSFASLAAFVGAEYARPESVSALQRALAARSAFTIIEACSDRSSNRAVHDDVIGAVVGSLR